MPHKHGAGFQAGNRWVVCDRCGFDYRLNYIKREWNGLIVCNTCYEQRHPQDFVKAVQDTIIPQGPVRTPYELQLPQNFTEQTDNIAGEIESFLGVGSLAGAIETINTNSIAGQMIAGAAIAGTD